MAIPWNVWVVSTICAKLRFVGFTVDMLQTKYQFSWSEEAIADIDTVKMNLISASLDASQYGIGAGLLHILEICNVCL